MLTAQPSTYPGFLKVQTCHLVTAQPSTYDMFGLIDNMVEKYRVDILLDKSKILTICPFVNISKVITKLANLQQRI